VPVEYQQIPVEYQLSTNVQYHPDLLDYYVRPTPEYDCFHQDVQSKKRKLNDE
jgi:hypothetical protein